MMPMLACGRFECDSAEMQELMGGHYPPNTEPGRTAYFKYFEMTVRSKYGEGALSDMQLLGTGPHEYESWLHR